MYSRLWPAPQLASWLSENPGLVCMKMGTNRNSGPSHWLVERLRPWCPGTAWVNDPVYTLESSDKGHPGSGQVALCPAMATSLTKVIARPRGASSAPPPPLPPQSCQAHRVCIVCVCFFFLSMNMTSGVKVVWPVPLPPIKDINSTPSREGQIAGKKQEQDINYELQPVRGLPMPGLYRPPDYSVRTSEPQPQNQAHCACVSQPLPVPAAPACTSVCSTPHLQGGLGCPSQDSSLPQEPAVLLPPAP